MVVGVINTSCVLIPTLDVIKHDVNVYQDINVKVGQNNTFFTLAKVLGS